MVDWTSLTDAYGSAANVPALIDDWATMPTESKLDNLWGRLCHQGTVYPASFAAISLLHDRLHNLQPMDRRSAFILAGAILASSWHTGVMPDEAVLQLIPNLQSLACSGLDDPDIEDHEFVHLLQAAASFRGEPLWGRVFDGLSDEEFEGVCPKCGSDMLIAMGKFGYFVSANDYVQGGDATRRPIMPAAVEKMQEIGVWLHEQATRRSRASLAKSVEHIFGITTCPTCDVTISVAAAIACAHST